MPRRAAWTADETLRFMFVGTGCLCLFTVVAGTMALAVRNDAILDKLGSVTGAGAGAELVAFISVIVMAMVQVLKRGE